MITALEADTLTLSFNTKLATSLSITNLHYVLWDDLPNLTVPNTAKKQLLSGWIVFSSNLLAKKKNDPTQVVILEGVDFACSELQSLLSIDSVPQIRKTNNMPNSNT